MIIYPSQETVTKIHSTSELSNCTLDGWSFTEHEMKTSIIEGFSSVIFKDCTFDPKYMKQLYFKDCEFFSCWVHTEVEPEKYYSFNMLTCHSLKKYNKTLRFKNCVTFR